MARATTTVHLAGRPRQEGTTISLTATRSQLGFWLGRGGAPLETAETVMRRHAKEATEEATELVHDETVRRMPRRSGKTERSIQQEVRREGDDFVGRVYSNYFVARLIEEGTGVYGPRRRMIRPTSGKFLRFPNRGGGGFRLTDAPRTLRGELHPAARWVFTRRVRGQRAQHVFRDSLRESRHEIYRIYRKHARLGAMEVAAL